MEDSLKTCSKCNIDKPKTQFHKCSSEKDGLRFWCKSCVKIYSKKYYSVNEGIIKGVVSEYNKAHREQINTTRKKEHRKVVTRTKQKLRLETDIQYKLKRNLGINLRKAIKRNTQSGKTIEYLGCSIAELRNYLEPQFKEGMVWEDSSTWTIDHIIPLSKFDLTDETEVRKACHYTNLQPLTLMDNIRKGNKILGGQDNSSLDIK